MPFINKLTDQQVTNKVHEHINKFRDSVIQYKKDELIKNYNERPFFKGTEIADDLGWNYHKVDPIITDYLSNVGYKEHIDEYRPIDRLELMFYNNDINKIKPAPIQTNPTEPKKESHLGRNLAIGAAGLGAAGLGVYLWHKSKKKKALQKSAMYIYRYYY